jgi:hypothetical protein
LSCPGWKLAYESGLGSGVSFGLGRSDLAEQIGRIEGDLRRPDIQGHRCAGAVAALLDEEIDDDDRPDGVDDPVAGEPCCRILGDLADDLPSGIR